jgi:D-arabinose 1-dehydrogenase-like Zn-dependent alcohol dehydrogenase
VIDAVDVFRNLTFAGSVVGNIDQTQEMLDFCGKHDITSMVEVRGYNAFSQLIYWHRCYALLVTFCQGWHQAS